MRPITLAALCVALSAFSAAQTGGDLQERVAVLKASVQKSIQQSAATLKQHEWIQTTTVSQNGDVKSTLMHRCYYGAEGKVQKIPVTPPQSGRKNENLTAYMKQALALVDGYVPVDSALVGRAMDAGKVTLQMLEPGKRIRFDIHDYMLKGDVFSLDVDVAKGHLLGLQVATYIDQPKDAVSLTIALASFPDGTLYPAKVTLDAKAKKVSVNVENSGFRKSGS